jgi:hypothetical protein
MKANYPGVPALSGERRHSAGRVRGRECARHPGVHGGGVDGTRVGSRGSLPLRQWPDRNELEVAHGKQANAHGSMLDHDNGATQEITSDAGEMLLQKDRELAGVYVPHSKQQQRRARRAVDRENTREIQIVRDDDVSSLPSDHDQRLVGRSLQAELANTGRRRTRISRASRAARAADSCPGAAAARTIRQPRGPAPSPTRPHR